MTQRGDRSLPRRRHRVGPPAAEEHALINGADITLTADGIPLLGDVTFADPAFRAGLLVARHRIVADTVTVHVSVRLRRRYPKRWSRAKRKAARARNAATWTSVVAEYSATVTEIRDPPARSIGWARLGSLTLARARG